MMNELNEASPDVGIIKELSEGLGLLRPLALWYPEYPKYEFPDCLNYPKMRKIITKNGRLVKRLHRKHGGYLNALW